MLFTSTERERLGVIVNNIGIYGSQLIQQTGAEFTRMALANLARVREQNHEVLRRLDELAREQGEESPLRLVEDMVRLPADAAQILTLLRRCLLVSAFLGRCLAESSALVATPTQPDKKDQMH